MTRMIKSSLITYTLSPVRDRKIPGNPRFSINKSQTIVQFQSIICATFVYHEIMHAICIHYRTSECRSRTLRAADAGLYDFLYNSHTNVRARTRARTHAEKKKSDSCGWILGIFFLSSSLLSRFLLPSNISKRREKNCVRESLDGAHVCRVRSFSV